MDGVRKKMWRIQLQSKRRFLKNNINIFTKPSCMPLLPKCDAFHSLYNEDKLEFNMNLI